MDRFGLYVLPGDWRGFVLSRLRGPRRRVGHAVLPLTRIQIAIPERAVNREIDCGLRMRFEKFRVDHLRYCQPRKNFRRCMRKRFVVHSRHNERKRLFRRADSNEGDTDTLYDNDAVTRLIVSTPRETNHEFGRFHFLSRRSLPGKLSGHEVDLNYFYVRPAYVHKKSRRIV